MKFPKDLEELFALTISVYQWNEKTASVVRTLLESAYTVGRISVREENIANLEQKMDSHER